MMRLLKEIVESTLGRPIRIHSVYNVVQLLRNLGDRLKSESVASCFPTGAVSCVEVFTLIELSGGSVARLIKDPEALYWDLPEREVLQRKLNVDVDLGYKIKPITCIEDVLDVLDDLLVSLGLWRNSIDKMNRVPETLLFNAKRAPLKKLDSSTILSLVRIVLRCRVSVKNILEQSRMEVF